MQLSSNHVAPTRKPTLLPMLHEDNARDINGSRKRAALMNHAEIKDMKSVCGSYRNTG
jgi:hypothetical protein